MKVGQAPIPTTDHKWLGAKRTTDAGAVDAYYSRGYTKWRQYDRRKICRRSWSDYSKAPAIGGNLRMTGLQPRAACSSKRRRTNRSSRRHHGKFNTTDTGSSTAAWSLASSLEASSAASATTNSGVTKTVDATECRVFNASTPTQEVFSVEV